MNIQTLNRMVKASYYAPNGAQLRKACYGLMAVNSRRASMNPAVALEQIEQLPKEEQVKVKTEIISDALIQSSKIDQAKFDSKGLRDIKNYLKENNIKVENLNKEIKKADPMIVEAMKTQIHGVEEAIEVTGQVAKARSFEEILSFLDLPISNFQQGYNNFNWYKFHVVMGGLEILLYSLIIIIPYGVSVGVPVMTTVGISLLVTTIGLLYYSAEVAINYYFFGDIQKLIETRMAKIESSVLTIPFKVLSFILKSFGWILDKVTSGLKGAWGLFFSKQAKIAMLSPEFKRAYYNI